MQTLKTIWEKFKQSPLPFILAVFIFSRIALLLTAWFAGYYLPNPTYQKYIDQGWFLSPHYWIDIWTHWDGRWYLDIAMNGYFVMDDIQEYYSNVAFFPLFPMLVKLISLVFPKALVSQSVYLLIGLIINNLFLIIGLYFLYRLSDDFFHSESLNKGIIVLFMAYPAAFYFSCFYTESLFFLLAVLCLYSAKQARWPLTALFAALLSITRPQGILILIPVAILLGQSIQWKWRRFPINALWLLAVPIPLCFHFLHMQMITGDYFAPISAQAAWGKDTSNWVENFINVFFVPGGDVFKIDAFLTYLFLALSIVALFNLQSIAYGVFALLILLVPIISGTSVSMTRYIAVAFPAFMALGKLLKKETYIYGLAAVFFAVQIFYFVGWVNYYWIA